MVAPQLVGVVEGLCEGEGRVVRRVDVQRRGAACGEDARGRGGEGEYVGYVGFIGGREKVTALKLVLNIPKY